MTDKDKLISDAARAAELFGEDELEAAARRPVPASVLMLTAITDECAEWMQNNVNHPEPFTGGVFVERRYLGDIIEGLQAEGFEQGTDYDITS